MKKALIVNPYWDTLGGGERYTASIVKHLLDRGWSVDIRWPHALAKVVKDRFGIDMSSANYVDEHVYTAKYQLAFFVSDGSVPLSFALKTMVHFQFPFRKVQGKSLGNRVKTSMYSYVCNSQFTKSHIDEEFGAKSHVLYPPIDTNAFLPGKKTKTILYVGRFSQLTQKKNIDMLAESFVRHQAKFDGWQLILAGGTSVGADTAYLEKITQLSKKANIKVVKNPSFSQLLQLNAQASIFWAASGFGVDDKIHSMQVEHFGMSLVEAMSAGSVPIVSNIGGHKEIIFSTHDGYLCDSMDEIIHQTTQLIATPKIWQTMSTHAVAKSHTFSIESFNSQFDKLLK